jgi:hypothetical protein
MCCASPAILMASMMTKYFIFRCWRYANNLPRIFIVQCDWKNDDNLLELPSDISDDKHLVGTRSDSYDSYTRCHARPFKLNFVSTLCAIASVHCPQSELLATTIADCHHVNGVCFVGLCICRPYRSPMSCFWSGFWVKMVPNWSNAVVPSRCSRLGTIREPLRSVWGGRTWLGLGLRVRVKG